MKAVGKTGKPKEHEVSSVMTLELRVRQVETHETQTHIPFRVLRSVPWVYHI